MNPKRFFAELKRRNVYKVAVAYTVIAWLLIPDRHPGLSILRDFDLGTQLVDLL